LHLANLLNLANDSVRIGISTNHGIDFVACVQSAPVAENHMAPCSLESPDDSQKEQLLPPMRIRKRLSAFAFPGANINIATKKKAIITYPNGLLCASRLGEHP
jgi:hypothetical protein